MPEPILRPWNYSWTCGEMRCGGGLRDGEKFHGKLRKNVVARSADGRLGGGSVGNNPRRR